MRSYNSDFFLMAAALPRCTAIVKIRKRHMNPKRHGQECPRSNRHGAAEIIATAARVLLFRYSQASLYPSRSAVRLRSSLASPRLLRSVLELTDLRPGRNGTPCRSPGPSGCRCRGPPPGSRTRSSPNCRPDPRGTSLPKAHEGRSVRNYHSRCRQTNPNTTGARSQPYHT